MEKFIIGRGCQWNKQELASAAKISASIMSNYMSKDLESTEILSLVSCSEY